MDPLASASVKGSINNTESQAKVEDPKVGFVRLLRKENKGEEEVERMIKYMDELGITRQRVIATLLDRYPDITHRKKICKVFKYLHIPKGEILFGKGDEGNAAYLILAGSVAIYSSPINKLMMDDVEAAVLKEEKKLAMLRRGTEGSGSEILEGAEYFEVDECEDIGRESFGDISQDGGGGRETLGTDGSPVVVGERVDQKRSLRGRTPSGV